MDDRIYLNLRPLTKEDMPAEALLSFEAFQVFLEEMSLSIDKVLYDTEYKAVVYADFENALYEEIVFELDGWPELIKSLQRLRTYRQEGAVHLKKFICRYPARLPLCLLAYDFNLRVKGLPSERIFSTWLMMADDVPYRYWNKETLECVFANVMPDYARPVPRRNGLVTLYLGLKDNSVNPKEIFTWTTYYPKAMKEAERRVAIIRVPLEGIAGAWNISENEIHGIDENVESEVIVRPGWVKEVEYVELVSPDFVTLREVANPFKSEWYSYVQELKRLHKSGAGYGNVYILHEAAFGIFITLMFYQYGDGQLTLSDKKLIIHTLIRFHLCSIFDYKDDGAAILEDKDMKIAQDQLNGTEQHMVNFLLSCYRISDLEILMNLEIERDFTEEERYRCLRLLIIFNDILEALNEYPDADCIATEYIRKFGNLATEYRDFISEILEERLE